MTLPVRYLSGLTVFFRVLLAGWITLAVSFYFDIPRPNWALISIVFIGFKVELGNIYVKSLARLVGTVVGGIAGILIIIFAGQSPLLVIILLSLVVWLCTTFTSRYQAMAGSASFLACITCLVVVLFNLNTNSQATILYFAVYRVVAISLGVVAMLISSLVIWPTSSQDWLTRSVVNLRSQIARLAELARHPEQYPYPMFLGLHTQLSRMVIDCDQQRYYTLFLDNRIGHLSGYLQRIILSVLDQMATLTMLRRILVRKKIDAEDCLAIEQAIEQECQELDSEMARLIHLLNHPEQIRKQDAEPGQNSLLNLQNWRNTLYGSLATVVPLVIGFYFWVMTGTPLGPLVALGCIMVPSMRVMAGAPRIPFSGALKAILLSIAIVFVTQYVLLVHFDSFWLLYLLSIPVLAVTVWSIHYKVSLIGFFCAILIPIMMPIANEQSFQPLALFNNALALFVGFFIGYLCVEVIGSPPRATLCKDYLQTLTTLLQRTMNRGDAGITPVLFRRQILPLSFAMLPLFPQQQEQVLNWLDTLASMGSMRLKLHGLSSSSQACDQTKATYGQALEQMAYLVNHLHLPTAAMAPADEERQQQMDSLFDRALTLYRQDPHQYTLDLLVLCACMRRHHEMSFTDQRV